MLPPATMPSPPTMLPVNDGPGHGCPATAVPIKAPLPEAMRPDRISSAYAAERIRISAFRCCPCSSSATATMTGEQPAQLQHRRLAPSQPPNPSALQHAQRAAHRHLRYRMQPERDARRANQQGGETGNDRNRPSAPSQRDRNAAGNHRGRRGMTARAAQQGHVERWPANGRQHHLEHQHRGETAADRDQPCQRATAASPALPSISATAAISGRYQQLRRRSRSGCASGPGLTYRDDTAEKVWSTASDAAPSGHRMGRPRRHTSGTPRWNT